MVIGPKDFRRSCFHGVFYHLWILQSFHLLPHKVPWALREEYWWSNHFWDWVFQVLSLSAHCPSVGLYICSRLLHGKLLCLWWWLGEKLINTYSRRSWGIIFAAVFFSRSSVRFSSRSLTYLVPGSWSCKQYERWGPFYELSLKSNLFVVGYSHNLFCRQVIIDMSCHLCYWTWPFCLLWDEISKSFWFSFLWWLRMLNFSSKYSSATWVSSVENSMYTYMPPF